MKCPAKVAISDRDARSMGNHEVVVIYDVVLVRVDF